VEVIPKWNLGTRNRFFSLKGIFEKSKAEDLDGKIFDNKGLKSLNL